MNRLVIIGNGFDLAHGLPTGYCNFINDFWGNLKNNHQDDLIKKIVTINDSYTAIFEFENIDSYSSFKSSLQKYSQEYGKKFSFNPLTLFEDNYSNSGIIFRFENELFRIICDKIEVENWVDIENIYYDILKDKGVSKIETLKYPHSIEKLNEEFHNIKELLENYLVTNVKNKYHFKVEGKNEILDLFRPKIIFPETEDYNKFLNQFPSSKHGFIKKYLEIFNIDSSFNQMVRFREKGYNDEVLILDFNYTPTTNYYLEKMYDYFFNPQVIKIHGELNNNKNPINFGFGDEYDDDYKSIENINKNEYLKNIKSFKYSNNTNYRKLMNFVFEKEFQVYILGHSCGLSDRTLLQSIFEHSNCLSIKPIYYVNNEGEDNYSDMVYNISRNFKNKIMMRDKIVDKTLSSILVQNIRFKEK